MRQAGVIGVPQGWAKTSSKCDWSSYQRAWRTRFDRAKSRSDEQKDALRAEARALARWLSERYDVDRVWLFGSLTDEDGMITDRSDIDLAVEGLKPEFYYTAVADLLDRASRSTDLVDLSAAQPALVAKVRESGVLLYERA